MELAELEQIIDRAKIDRVTKLDLSNQRLTMLPESIGDGRIQQVGEGKKVKKTGIIFLSPFKK